LPLFVESKDAEPEATPLEIRFQEEISSCNCR
jgi:hypothetical protein